MSLSQSLLPEFDHEMAMTRNVLQRVADDKLAWKPHAKSWDMRSLATHLANLPSWTNSTIDQPDLDFAPVGGPPYVAPMLNSREEILATFDQAVATAHASLAAASDETLLANWTLLKGGTVILTMPRIAVLRSFVLNHMVHHRGQFTIYLRLNDISVPALYGPSADES